MVTHSLALVEHLRVALSEDGRSDDLEVIGLAKNLGEAVVKDQSLLSRPTWEWGSG
ncbi:MAG: hypothetical protein ABIS84_12390 [Arachnia sp.]